MMNLLNLILKNQRIKNRDRLILSKGHGCLALYAILADKNFFKSTLSRIMLADSNQFWEDIQNL